MILLRLFYEFFKVGLFSVGGGLATIPFLADMGTRTGWFSSADLANMIAVSESTPGPIGVNMATYVGFHTAGIFGGIVATLGLVCPAFLTIAVIAGFLKKFRESRGVSAVFYGLRPASTALIAAAFLEVCAIALIRTAPAGAALLSIHWPALILAAAVFFCIQFTPLKKLHPIVFIGISALAGIAFQM